MSKAQPSGRLSDIQILRGVAALLVVLVHAINVSDWRVAQGIDDRPATLAVTLALNEFGASGVDLFFVISGFVMAMMLANRPDQRVTAFAIDRLIRIVPLFWLASASFALAMLAAGRPITAEGLIAAITILPLPVGDYAAPVLVVGWSLGFELLFYGLVAASLALAPRRRAAVVTLALGAAALAGVMAPPSPGLTAYLANPIMAEFLLGIGCYWLWRAGDGRVSALSARLLSALGLALILRTAIVGYPFDTPHLPIIAGQTGLLRTLYWGLPWAVMTLGLLLDPARNRHSASSFIHRIGDASYSLYLVHMLPCLAAESLVPGGLVAPDLLLLAVVLTSVGLGLLVHRTIEVPMLRWMRAAWTARQDKRALHPA